MIAYYALFLIFVAGGLVWLFLTMPAGRIVGVLSMVLPIGLVAIGGFLTLFGKGTLGLPMVAFGVAWWRLTGGQVKSKSTGSGRKSTVLSAALEMQLDHDTGEINGRILTGHYEGNWLSELAPENLFDLYSEIQQDQESAALLETYLDRIYPDWQQRSGAKSERADAGHTASGDMTKQEAYQILGLEAGASEAEIKKAWRNLMKNMHPDSGGSAYLASKINAAKDILLG